MKYSILFFVFVIGLSAASSSALAERVLIKNRDHHFSVSYPDTWHRMTNQKPDEAFHIVAPGKDHHAKCRVRVREDRRFGLYPRHKFATSIQNVAHSADFWESYLGEYDGAQIITLDNGTGLSHGHGSTIETQFYETTGPHVAKRSIASVGYLNDRAYIYECSSNAAHFAHFYPMFLNVLSTVKIRKIGSHNTNGRYRNFTADKEQKINGLREIDAYYY